MFVVGIYWKCLDVLWRIGEIIPELTIKMPRKPSSENVICLCRLLNILANFSNLFLRPGNSVDPDQTAPISLIWVHTVCKNDF